MVALIDVQELVRISSICDRSTSGGTRRIHTAGMLFGSGGLSSRRQALRHDRHLLGQEIGGEFLLFRGRRVRRSA